MRRREFVGLLSCAAAGVSLPTVAQQPPVRMPMIGFLGATSPSSQSKSMAAFLERLRVLGWVGGQNVAIEFRWIEGRTERASDIVAEFVRLKVDVIVTSGAGPVLAATQSS